MFSSLSRSALEDARTGERHGFADLSRPYAFLEAHTVHQLRTDPDTST
jgi:hypothetical protein